MDIESYWKDILNQDEKALKRYFHANAYINWHNTNEHFTTEEFIKANCEYPEQWDGEIERIEETGDLVITAVHVFSKGKNTMSFHVTSFIRLLDDKIISVDEYWGDDGKAPQWRQDLNIGTKIK